MRTPFKHSLTIGSLALALCHTHTISADTELPSNLKHSVFDGACLYMKDKKLLDGYSNDMDKEYANIAKEWYNKIAKDKTPLCEIKSPAGVLLVTANFVDQATLSAARGIDAIEQALGFKQTLTNLILELEQALAGEDPLAQVNAKTVSASVTIGERAKEIEIEIDKRKDSLSGSQEFRDLISQSQIALNTANYYQAESALGAKTFRQYWTDASEAERLQMIKQNSKQGLTYAFAADLPDRALKMVTNVVDTVKLASNIHKALDNSTTKSQKEQMKKAHRAETKKATRIAKDIDARTNNTFAVATAEPDAKAPAAAKQLQTQPEAAPQPETTTAADTTTCNPAPEKEKNRWKVLAASTVKKALGTDETCQ